MKYDVFISHSSKDRKDVDRIVHYLENNNFRCFVSYRDIPHNNGWADVLVKALEESRCVVYIHTSASNDSNQIIREIQIAVDVLKRPFITYRLTDEDFKGGKKYFLQTLNWIDSLNSPVDGLPLLANTIKETLDGSFSQVKNVEKHPSKNNIGKLVLFSLLPIVLLVVTLILLKNNNARIQRQQIEQLQKAYEHYTYYATSAKSCLGNPDSLAVFEQYLLQAQDISSQYQSQSPSLFTFDLESIRDSQRDTLISTLEPLIQQVIQWYDVYSMMPSEYLKQDIKHCISQIESIHIFLNTPPSESIIEIKKQL